MSLSQAAQSHDIRQLGINPNHWYVVALSREVKTQPLGVTLWKQATGVSAKRRLRQARKLLASRGTRSVSAGLSPAGYGVRASRAGGVRASRAGGDRTLPR